MRRVPGSTRLSLTRRLRPLSQAWSARSSSRSASASTRRTTCGSGGIDGGGRRHAALFDQLVGQQQRGEQQGAGLPTGRPARPAPRGPWRPPSRRRGADSVPRRRGRRPCSGARRSRSRFRPSSHASTLPMIWSSSAIAARTFSRSRSSPVAALADLFRDALDPGKRPFGARQCRFQCFLCHEPDLCLRERPAKRRGG